MALSLGGVVALVATWLTERNHSVELLPNIDRLLAEGQRTKDDIEAIFVDVGPGGYAGLRVGVSIAKALAHGLAVPIAGVGRLEIDAFAVAAEAGEQRVIAVHRAGRGELAWAAYRAGSDGWHEELAPRISKLPALEAEILEGGIVTGDIDAELADLIAHRGASVASAHQHRVVVLAAIGARRLSEGRADDAIVLVPMYLRAPAIGPQR